MPPMYLQVNLAGQSKEISEHGGAPEAYYDLEAFLLGGAGAEGEEYVPERGYLSATPFAAGNGAPEWPEGASVTPAEVGEGQYIAGETLAFVWSLVNRNPTAPVYVECEGTTYVIMVQVPGVSFFEPPEG